PSATLSPYTTLFRSLAVLRRVRPTLPPGAAQPRQAPDRCRPPVLRRQQHLGLRLLPAPDRALLRTGDRPDGGARRAARGAAQLQDRKSTRLNSSHVK